jgi:pilus assembly protein Flp/PilA
VGKVDRGSGMKQLMKQLVHDDSGQDLIEYALVIAVIAFGCIAAIGGLANPVVNSYYTLTNNFNNGV